MYQRFGQPIKHLLQGNNIKFFFFFFFFLEKTEVRTGENGATGNLTSPFFPSNYAMNAEVYTYTVNSTSLKSFIRITFDDWLLANTSILYVSLISIISVCLICEL